VELSLSGADRDFAEEARTWLAEHLTGDFARYGGVGGPADDEAWEVRVAWDRELAAGGWLGLSWPVEYGGRGLSLRHEVIFAIESARANPPYRASVQGLELLGPMLLARGSAEQKRRFLPPILRVEEFWGQGFSEPGAGSDLAALATRARLVKGKGPGRTGGGSPPRGESAGGDEWVLDGQKAWTTTGNHAHWLYVLARTSDQPRHRGLTMLLVPVAQPGVDIRPVRNLSGAAEFCETFLRGARTAADLAVGEPGDGWGVAMAALGTERGTSLVAQQMGFAREVARLTEALTAGLGLPPPALRYRLVDAWMSARVARWQVLRLMETVLADGDPGLRPSVCKVFASSFHQRLGALAVDLLGAAGQVTGPGYELSEIQRTALTCVAESIYGGTTEIQLNLIAERALGLPREGTRR
jgi:alkylation response protein AidB-like acyl-CoA dehydrogenase